MSFCTRWLLASSPIIACSLIVSSYTLTFSISLPSARDYRQRVSSFYQLTYLTRRTQPYFYVAIDRQKDDYDHCRCARIPVTSYNFGCTAYALLYSIHILISFSVYIGALIPVKSPSTNTLVYCLYWVSIMSLALSAAHVPSPKQALSAAIGCTKWPALPLFVCIRSLFHPHVSHNGLIGLSDYCR